MSKKGCFHGTCRKNAYVCPVLLGQLSSSMRGRRSSPLHTHHTRINSSCHAQKSPTLGLQDSMSLDQTNKRIFLPWSDTLFCGIMQKLHFSSAGSWTNRKQSAPLFLLISQPDHGLLDPAVEVGRELEPHDPSALIGLICPLTHITQRLQGCCPLTRVKF